MANLSLAQVACGLLGWSSLQLQTWPMLMLQGGTEGDSASILSADRLGEDHRPLIQLAGRRSLLQVCLPLCMRPCPCLISSCSMSSCSAFFLLCLPHGATCQLRPLDCTECTNFPTTQLLMKQVGSHLISSHAFCRSTLLA